MAYLIRYAVSVLLGWIKQHRIDLHFVHTYKTYLLVNYLPLLVKEGLFFQRKRKIASKYSDETFKEGLTHKFPPVIRNKVWLTAFSSCLYDVPVPWWSDPRCRHTFPSRLPELATAGQIHADNLVLTPVFLEKNCVTGWDHYSVVVKWFWGHWKRAVRLEHTVINRQVLEIRQMFDRTIFTRKVKHRGFVNHVHKNLS